MELMDCPHPLEVLADPNAYLERGSISRYHNPDNYTLVGAGKARASFPSWRLAACLTLTLIWPGLPHLFHPGVWRRV